MLSAFESEPASEAPGLHESDYLLEVGDVMRVDGRGDAEGDAAQVTNTMADIVRGAATSDDGWSSNRPVMVVSSSHATVSRDWVTERAAQRELAVIAHAVDRVPKRS